MNDINWKAVASWLRKEAGEHVNMQTVDVFMGLARAIEYGIETQELAEAKNRFFGVEERGK